MNSIFLELEEVVGNVVVARGGMCERCKRRDDEKKDLTSIKLHFQYTGSMILP